MVNVDGNGEGNSFRPKRKTEIAFTLKTHKNMIQLIVPCRGKQIQIFQLQSGSFERS